MSKKEVIQALIDKMHCKIENDEHIKTQMMPLKKIINIDLGCEQYSFKIENAIISELEEKLSECGDLTLTTSPEDFQCLVDGTLRPMRAYITKRIKIQGHIEDLMFLKKLF